MSRSKVSESSTMQALQQSQSMNSDAMSQSSASESSGQGGQAIDRILNALTQIEGRLSTAEESDRASQHSDTQSGSVMHSTSGSYHSYQQTPYHPPSYSGSQYSGQQQHPGNYMPTDQQSMSSASGSQASYGQQPYGGQYASSGQSGTYSYYDSQSSAPSSQQSYYPPPGSFDTMSQTSQSYQSSYDQSQADSRSIVSGSQASSYSYSASDVSKYTSASGMSGVTATQNPSSLPVYYQKLLADRMADGYAEPEHDNPVGRVKSLEKNPVNDVVSDRRSMIIIVGIVFALNAAVFLVLFMRRLFPPPSDSFLRNFPLEAFALIAFVLIKLIVSWFYNPKPDSQVIVDGEPILIFIPIYNEPEEILAKTLGAIHNQTFSNRSITLMIVVDHDAGGLINALNVLMADISDGVENPVTGDLEYRGTFNDMAYLVVMKRHHSGKHGSEIILVRYLQKHPNDFKFLVTVDSDTILHPDAVSNIITAMCRTDQVIAACGKVMIANETATLVTRLQAFIYTVNHIVDKHFQGFIDFITCLPGCFCAIRIEPLVNPEKDYWGIHLDKNHQLNYTREAITALDRNLLLMGEDRWRTNLLLFAREKGEKIVYVPYAGCDTFCPETLQQYIAQQRRWFISTVVNQVILLTKGRMWIKNPMGVFTEGISLFGSLVMPVICLFLFATILLIIWDLNNLGFISAMVVLAMLAFTCYLHGRFRHILYVWIFLPLAPVIMIYIPMYSFATFASDSWGTRGSRKDISARQKRHLYLTYFVTFVLTVIMLTVMFCATVGTKCLF